MIEQRKRHIEWVRTTDSWAVLALFISSLLFFYDLFEGRYLLTERDLAPYFIPPRFFWVESLKQGSFPLWNPYQFAGQPFFANPQHAVLYPLNGLFFLLPFDVAFNGIIVLHFFLGGFFTYHFLRDIKASRTGSLVSAFIFMLGGYLLSVHSLLTILLSVTWTPLIMLFARRGMEQPGMIHKILAAVFMAISFFGGGIEIVYGNFLILLVMVLFSSSSSFIIVLKNMGGLVAISVIFLFLSAVQLLPFIELWMHSIRGAGISYQEATVWSFAPKDFLLFFLPDAYGYFLDMKNYWVTQCWLKTMYTGGLPFLLSFVFFFMPAGETPHARGSRRDRLFFFSLMVFSLFFSFGQYNPLYPFVYQYVPFFNGIRYPVKFLYLFVLALSVTAGLGFDRLAQFSKERENRALKHVLILFSLFSGLILLGLVLGHREIEHFLRVREIDFPLFNHLSTNLYHGKRFFFYLALFFLLLRVGYEARWKSWARVFLITFLVADLLGNMGFYGKERSEDYFKKTEILKLVTADQEPFRIFSTPKTIALDTPVLIGHGVPFDLIKEKHLPSLNMLFRAHDIWGIDVVRLKRGEDLYKKLTTLPSISDSRLIDLYGAKYIVSVTPLEGDSRFELVYARLEGLEGGREELLKQHTIKLYRNRNALPRAWLVRDFQVMDAEAVLSAITQKDFDPWRAVFLDEEPGWEEKSGGHRGAPLQNIKNMNDGAGEPLRGLPKSVKFIAETNNRLSLRVEAETDSILVLSDTYDPGWRVFIEGREEKVLRANYNFRGVAVPGGTSRVEFIYNPFSFKLGIGLTVVGAIACGMITWVVGRSRSGRKGRWRPKESIP